MLCSAPVMSYVDYEKPFVLHVDASHEGLGAILYQQGSKKELGVIAYGSRTPAEKNYHSGKLEFLALRWAVTERVRDYLYYAPTFTVFSDNNPLTYVMSTARIDATGHRWVAEMADFNFEIRYKPGLANKNADGLSRMPLDIDRYMSSCSNQMSKEDIEAVFLALTALENGETAWVTSLAQNEQPDGWSEGVKW